MEIRAQEYEFQRSSLFFLNFTSDLIYLPHIYIDIRNFFHLPPPTTISPHKPLASSRMVIRYQLALLLALLLACVLSVANAMPLAENTLKARADIVERQKSNPADWRRAE
ncbi:hypothetical protein F5878DRAFT_615216 [Lentinula raphanica]|uniref:Uncharacterized protein n=1 Tax=Lentinula raphanica TaxID=153919 RepID=A0AA38PBC2_9AGAR|nr:hypothetical protein F5878DRAFT_615216 [Lentinula raphanica]